MRSVKIRSRASAGLLTALVGLLLVAAPASAASTTYPAGGSGFATGAEGWSPGASSCAPIALLCTPEAAYDSGTGNPPGSIAAKTTVTVNLIDLFKGTEVWNSPQFTVPVGSVTGARIRLDRAFSTGGLVELGPTATYTVSLNDLTTGTSSKPLTEEVTKADTTFATRSASASVVSGHTYQLSIESVTAQSAVSLSVLSGTTALRFDNVGLEVETSAGGGGGGSGSGNGSNSNSSKFSSKELSRLLNGGATMVPAVLKGNRLFVKVSCPARIGRACHIRAQGMLSKKEVATAARTAKVRKGAGRRVVLRVKPKARKVFAKRRRVLVRQVVHAGKTKATLFQQRKLIRR
jgi:hypothetical protein